MKSSRQPSLSNTTSAISGCALACATEDDAPQIAADFCDFVRGAGVTRGAFGFSVVDMLVATMVNWEMEPEVKAAFLTTCLFEAAPSAAYPPLAAAKEVGGVE